MRVARVHTRIDRGRQMAVLLKGLHGAFEYRRGVGVALHGPQDLTQVEQSVAGH